MKLSEYIKQLQYKLNNTGDGEIYMLGECFEYYTPHVTEEIETDTVWNKELEDFEEVNKSVKYRIFGGYF